MRYRVLSAEWRRLNLVDDDGVWDTQPVVHVFRDDELDIIAVQLITAIDSNDWISPQVILDVLRNHTRSNP